MTEQKNSKNEIELSLVELELQSSRQRSHIKNAYYLVGALCVIGVSFAGFSFNSISTLRSELEAVTQRVNSPEMQINEATSLSLQSLSTETKSSKQELALYLKDLKTKQGRHTFKYTQFELPLSGINNWSKAVKVCNKDILSASCWSKDTKQPALHEALNGGLLKTFSSMDDESNNVCAVVCLDSY